MSEVKCDDGVNFCNEEKSLLECGSVFSLTSMKLRAALEELMQQVDTSERETVLLSNQQSSEKQYSSQNMFDDVISSHFGQESHVMGIISSEAKYRIENQILLKENENIKFKNDSLLSKNFELRETIASMNVKMKEEREAFCKLEQTNAKVMREKEAKEGDRLSLLNAAQIAQTQVKALQDQLRNSNTESNRTAVEQNQLKDELNCKQTMVLELLQECSKLTQSLEMSTHELQVSKALSLDLQTEVSLSAIKLEACNSKLARLDNRRLMQLQLTTSLSSENEILRSQLIQCERNLSAMSDTVALAITSEKVTTQRFEQILAVKEEEIERLQSTSKSNELLNTEPLIAPLVPVASQVMPIFQEGSMVTTTNSIDLEKQMPSTSNDLKSDGKVYIQPQPSTLHPPLRNSSICPFCFSGPFGLMVGCGHCLQEYHSSCTRKLRLVNTGSGVARPGTMFLCPACEVSQI